MFNWIKAKWNQFRINHYLKARRKGCAQAKALSKGWLGAEAALNILNGTLNYHLSNIGKMFFEGGRFRSNMDQDQLTLVMVSMVDLLPVLPEAKQKEVLDYLKGLRQHNWGYVRNAAYAALEPLGLEEIAPFCGDQNGDYCE